MQRRPFESYEEMEILRRARGDLRRLERPGPEPFQTAGEVERYMQLTRFNIGTFLPPFSDYSVRTAQPGHDQLGEQGVITRGRVIPSSNVPQPIIPVISKPIRRSIRRVQLRLTSPEHQQTTARRLLTEANEVRTSPPRSIMASPKGDDLYEWFGAIEGPLDTPYRGGVFFFSVEIPQDYPFRPPKVTFQTRIYHPNIDHTGVVCIESLEESKWRSTIRLINVLEMLISMFYGAVADDALMPIIAKQYQEDRPEFERTAQLWSQKYAS